MKRDRIPFWAEFIIWMIGNVVLSTFIPIANIKGKWLDQTQAILLGVMVSVALITAETFFYLTKLSEKDDLKTVLWDTLHNFDNRLSTIRKYFHNIAENRRSDPDLFQQFFENEAQKFQELISDASRKQELIIDQKHFTNTTVALECFRGERGDIFRGVHMLQENDFFLTGYPKQFFKQISEKVKKKEIKQVKRLLVYKNEGELNSQVSLQLIKYHETTPGFICKIMSYENYYRILESEQMREFPDFGLYGNKYLYRAVVTKIDENKGIWSKNSEHIEKYIRFFENFFNSTFASSSNNLGIDLNNVSDLKL